MSRQDTLKRQNAPLIHALLIVHVAVFAFVLTGPELAKRFESSPLVEMIINAGWPAAVALTYAYLTKLVLLGIVPATVRDRLVHWRFRHPLPGARAFSVIGPKDRRVDMEALINLHGHLPEKAELQDTLFYRVYQSVSGESGVLDAHGNYLAARDMTTINLIMMLGLPLVMWWVSGDAHMAISYGSVLLVAYVLSALAAQQYGVRLVQNVLAAAGAKPVPKTKEYDL